MYEGGREMNKLKITIRDFTLDGDFELTEYSGPGDNGRQMRCPEYKIEYSHPTFLMRMQERYECVMESEDERLNKVNAIILTEIPIMEPDKFIYKTQILFIDDNRIAQRVYKI